MTIFTKKFRGIGWVLALFLFSTCKSVEIGSEATKKLIFSDTFDTQLDKIWRRGTGEKGSGKWTIDAGWLAVSAVKNDPLWLTKPLPENFLVEFDAKSISAEGDLKCEILGDGVNHASGYILIFGGWNNALDVIARQDEHGKDRKQKKSKKVVLNKTYHFSISRQSNLLVWKIDGKPFMKYKDKNPLKGKEHQFFAFSNWMAPVRFDNLKIFELP